jgi:hypothetical protein
MSTWLSRAIITTILLMGAAAPVVAQTRTITGRVTAQGTGEPLPGVEVGIAQGMGMRAGSSTLTGTDGAFTLRVPDAPVTLDVRGLGYKRKEVPVPANQ